MNRHTPPDKAAVDDDGLAPHAPKNRDEMVQENRAKRGAPAAPGHPDDTIPEPRTRPVTTLGVVQPQPGVADHEVRAGPGDAGASDRPDVLPQTPKSSGAMQGNRGLMIAVIGVVLLLLLVAMF